MRWIKSLLVNGTMLAIVGFVLFVVLHLQECSGDEVRDAAKKANVAYPLQEPWVEVTLAKMVLQLKVGDAVIRSYDIGYGPGVPGSARIGVRATPLGEFRVVRKEKRKDVMNRGSRFIIINHPGPELAEDAWQNDLINDDDYRRILAAHDLEGLPTPPMPPTNTPLGGPLGIQGNYVFWQERRSTDGSIALSNGEINELYEHLPVGARVVIRDR